MKIKKFTAASIPEALNLVRNEMGDDALILGTSRSPGRKGRAGRVEVVAARDRASARIASRVSRRPQAEVGGGPRVQVGAPGAVAVAGAADAAGLTGEGTVRPGKTRTSLPRPSAGETRRESGRGKGAASQSKEIKEMRKLDRDIVTELKQIETRLKELLEGLDTPVAWRGDRVSPVNRDIINAGFDPAMLEGKIPASLLRSDAASDQLVKALVGGIPVARTEDRILAFLGPSGSGKTTTLLKIARTVFLDNNVRPRVVFFGRRDDDTSWLKAQCKRQGLKFTHISRLDKMAKLIKKEKSPVLIDTPGISDLGDTEMRFLVEASKEVAGMGLRLVVDATMDPWNVCAIASCIPQASGMSLVLTKLDEATRIGGAVSASIASGIPVAFVTGGRDVGDGVHVPDTELLSEKILDGVRSVASQGAGGRG